MTAPALVTAVDRPRRRPSRPTCVESPIFGTLAITPERVVHFPDGLFGFRGCTRFALVSTARADAWWLQGLDEPSLAFLLVDPFRIVPGFSVEIGSTDLNAIGAPDPADVAVLAITTLPREATGSPTANLQGPLALNLRTGLGRQLALGSSAFGTRHPFRFPQAA